MGKYANIVHLSSSSLGPNERFGVEEDDEFQKLVQHIENKKQIDINNQKQYDGLSYINSYEIKTKNGRHRLYVEYNLKLIKTEHMRLTDYTHMLQKYDEQGTLLKELVINPYLKWNKKQQTFSFKVDCEAKYMLYKINDEECFRVIFN